MFVPDSRKNLFLCYSWLVIYIEHLIQMEAWKRAVIRADRNRWNTCFLLLLLLFLFFFLFLRVFFIPIAWQSTSGSYQGYMRPKQWNKEKKIFFFLYYFDNVDFVWELLICAVVRSLLVVAQNISRLILWQGTSLCDHVQWQLSPTFSHVFLPETPTPYGYGEYESMSVRVEDFSLSGLCHSS